VRGDNGCGFDPAEVAARRGGGLGCWACASACAIGPIASSPAAARMDISYDMDKNPIHEPDPRHPHGRSQHRAQRPAPVAGQHRRPQVVGEAANGEALLELLATRRPTSCWTCPCPA
jgi:hypothetical protein